MSHGEAGTACWFLTSLSLSLANAQKHAWHRRTYAFTPKCMRPHACTPAGLIIVSVRPNKASSTSLVVFGRREHHRVEYNLFHSSYVLHLANPDINRLVIEYLFKSRWSTNESAQRFGTWCNIFVNLNSIPEKHFHNPSCLPSIFTSDLYPLPRVRVIDFIWKMFAVLYNSPTFWFCLVVISQVFFL